MIINELVKLMEIITTKDVPENENLTKVVNIVKKNPWFQWIKKGRRLKILTPKQMLEKLPIAIAQVNAGNTSHYLLNEIRQIIYNLYQTKKILKSM